MYIDGKWVDAKNGKTFAVYNPASGEIVDHMPDGGSDDAARGCKPGHRIRSGARG